MWSAKVSLISLWRGTRSSVPVRGFWYTSCFFPCFLNTQPWALSLLSNAPLFMQGLKQVSLFSVQGSFLAPLPVLVHINRPTFLPVLPRSSPASNGLGNRLNIPGTSRLFTANRYIVNSFRVSHFLLYNIDSKKALTKIPFSLVPILCSLSYDPAEL